MRKIFYFFLFFIFLCPSLFGQSKNQMLLGKISHVAFKNVYVKFDDTKNIKIGDTLKFLNQKAPCLLVKNKSSKSLVCITINNCSVKKGDAVYFNYRLQSDDPIEKTEPSITINRKETKNTAIQENTTSNYIEKIKGKISVASSSNLSGIRSDNHRMMYRFSLYADHINNSKFSVDSYLNYRQYMSSEESQFSNKKNIFKVYNLSLKYDVDPTLSVFLGRKINNKTSSLGAIDGLQVEKYFGKNFIGVITGFRPDMGDYNFNSNLFEYGGYFGRISGGDNFYSQTTLGILEQRNGKEIDRRYSYFQHSSTLMKKLHLFSSFEIDLYSKLNDLITNDIRLTNMYISARYRFTRKFDLMLSYDSRKRILYYETFQTEIERLLNDDEARQGFRARINVKPLKNVYTGVSISKRFQSNIQNKSDNINAYIRLSKIPRIGGRLSLNFNQNTSNYLESNVISIRHSRNLFRNKLYADFYYRRVDYNYFNNNTNNIQNYFGTNLSLNISRTLRFSIFGELSTSSNLENNYRINTAIVKRFNNKRKK